MLTRFVVFTVACAALVVVLVTVSPSWSRVALGLPTWLVIGAALADALTPLGLLNFLVLQWFGVRVCKRYMDASGIKFGWYRVGMRVNTSHSDGRSLRCRIVERDDVHVRLMRYGVLRWICPLTGWWADFRWIARRS